jgi:hypothetical protein
MFAGPSRGKPIIQSFYRKPINSSVAIFKATNSEPSIDVSTVFCRFETISPVPYSQISKHLFSNDASPDCPHDLHQQKHSTELPYHEAPAYYPESVLSRQGRNPANHTE